jgi:vacuolar-type H+-ATPase subunit I/STV1
MAEWSELKRLAEAQPNKHWTRDEGRLPYRKSAERMYGVDGPIYQWDYEDYGLTRSSASYIAAADPATVLALIAENEQLREDHDKQWRLAQSGIQNIEAVLAENANLRTESEALSSLLRRFVENEHNPDEDQNERHWYHSEAETLLAKISGEYRDYVLVPEETLQKIVSERDQLRAEVEALRKDAERYRWLRSAENDVAITFGIHAWEDLSDEFMDAAIDAAMGKGGHADV